MDKNYQLALITGGSSGIGLALAKRLVQDGTSVCLLARDKKKLRTAKKELAEHLSHKDQFVDILSCDITDYPAISKTLTTWTKRRGSPDLLINSAGITYPGYFQDLDLGIFRQMMDGNFFGTLHTIKCLLPSMIERGSGTVVNISSQAGFVGVFGYSAYGASKYAVRGFSDVLRAEMKPLGIQVSVVFPPDTQTPQLEFEEPLKPPETKAIAGSAKALSADQVAQSILKGIHKGKYVIIPGLEGKIFYRLIGMLGNLTYPVMDWLVRNSKKKH